MAIINKEKERTVIILEGNNTRLNNYICCSGWEGAHMKEKTI